MSDDDKTREELAHTGDEEERESLRRRLDHIEGAYEYFLAYAAQGTLAAAATGADGEVRSQLERFSAALGGLAELFRRVADPAAQPFLEVLDRDLAATAAALQLVLEREAISSQLIDNFNASVHVRALLTDLFLLDEALDLGAAR